MVVDGGTPFVLLARITVKEGMLFHNFDADPDDQNKFFWTEIYRKSEDFLFHADNPPVQEYVTKHSELATHF